MTQGGQTTAPKKSGIWRGLGSLAGICAAIVGAYAGVNLLIPAVAAGIIGLILWKAKLLKDKLLIQAISVQGGHACWMLFGLLIGVRDTAAQIEILAYGAAVVAFALHPRKWTAIILLAYQGVTLLINFLQFSNAQFGGGISRALASHLSFWVAAVILLIMLLRRGLPMPSSEGVAAVFD